MHERAGTLENKHSLMTGVSQICLTETLAQNLQDCKG